MPKNRMTEKLITAFNADNLFYNTVNTNLTLERGTLRDYIVIKFDKDMDYERCMSYMKSLKEKLIKRFFITEDDAGIAFDMRSFPFNLTEGKLQPRKKGIRYVVPVDEGTVFNLKSYLMSSFVKDIEGRLGKIFGVEYIDNSVGSAEFDRGDYLYCMYCENKEVRDKFIELFQSDITSYNNVYSKLFEVKGNYVYIKDVFKNNIPLIDRMIERSFWLEGRYLQVPSSENKYVESMKHRIVSLINAKSSIPFYHTFRASYLDSKENSVFIPIMPSTDGSFRFLTQKEAKNINKVFGYSVLHNIDGCITKKQLVELLGEDCVKGIYGINFYDKETSRYIMSKVIQESVINKDHELSIDPGLRFQALSRSPSTELSDTEWESPTRGRGEGLEKHPRRRSKKEEETEPFRGVLGEEIGQASTSSQQTDDMPRRSYTSRCRQEPLMSQPSTLRELLLSEGVYESMPIEIRGQQVRYRPSSIPFPTAWDNSISLNFGISEDSPKDKENICNEEHKEQKVIDNSDQKSSDECSEAKSQESESPEKKHGGGLFCKKGMPILAKLSPFKRHSVERDTMCSSKSDLVYHVTEKSSVSKPFFSFPTRIKAKSNPPSGVTSPTHEGGSEWQQRLDPDQREELCKVLSPEMKEKLNSGFFLPGYEKLLHLLYVDSETLHSLLSTSEGAEQVCSVLPPEKGKQLHSDLPFKAKKGLLFKFFDDEQEISRNVSTSSADSGYSSGLPASPAVPHKKSVSSEFKKCSVQQVKHMSEALEKNGGF